MGTHFQCKISSLAETEKLALSLADLAEPGDIILLNGPLGAGKTTFSQFFGKGLGVPDSCYITITSFLKFTECLFLEN